MTSEHSGGSLVVDVDAHEVTLDGLAIHLTRAEFTLLATLAEYPRRAFSREYLTQVLTNSEWASDTHALDTVVCRLRHKLGETGSQARRVVTVHGYGYRFEPDKAPDLAAAMTSNVQPPLAGTATLSLFALVSLDRSILWASDSYTQLLGWQPSDLQGTAIYDLMHRDDQRAAMAIREELDRGFPAAAFGRLRSTAGDYRLFKALVRPIIDPHGDVTSFLGEFREATAAQVIELTAPSPIFIKRPEATTLG